MKTIDTEISNLVENMFPAFYEQDGENFVTFVKAYYEWLEQNHQLIELEDYTDFNVGDTIQQDTVTGTIVAEMDNGLLVYVDGLDTFKCFNVCAELLPITSSSGGSTLVTRGGMTKRLGTLFLARKLLELRDVDKTLDLFVIRFKEKYLKNIEFDIQTNKQLLVKNSLDLYRSKGTQRSIDLFFRLIYGATAEVYYPGDDVMRLSDGEWVRPRYIEISSSSVDRAISLVGKQVTGVTSGATAFVEKYIKRKIKDGYVHVLYVSNASGDFINRELLKSDSIYSDSPTVVGSLSSVEIITGSRLFKVGDVVSFNSTKGDHGLARVASISNRTGVVDFILIDGGFGYTESANSSYSAQELEKRTQSIVSEKVLTLSNVAATNTVAGIVAANGGSGYSNSDVAVVVSPWSNAYGKILTNGAGSIQTITMNDGGSGFYVLNPNVAVQNSSGGLSSGTSAVLVATTVEPSSYFKYFEDVNQIMATIDYDSSPSQSQFAIGELVFIGNSTVDKATGIILLNSNTSANSGTIILGVNAVAFSAGDKIKLETNTSITANVISFTYEGAKGKVMGVPNSAIFTLSSLIGTIDRGDEVYQLNSTNVETGNAIVSSASLSTTAGSIELSDLTGVFHRNRPLRVRNKTTTANLTSQQLTVGLYDISNNFVNTYNIPIYSTNTGTFANVLSVSAGSGASFRVGTISEAETIYLNTDLLSANNEPTVGANQEFMTVNINAAEYGFPKNPVGNSSAVIFSCLNFDQFTIGTIASLTSINPGADYNVDPYVLAYQPYITGFDLHDYIITVANTTGAFVQDERFEQQGIEQTVYDLTVSSAIGYTVGDKVYQGTIGAETATGIIDSITLSTNTIRVRDVTGTFAASATVLKDYSDAGLAATTSAVLLATVTITAKAIVKSSTPTTIYAKRIQFNNTFQVGMTIVGGSSGATGVITNIVEDRSTLQIGVNALIEGNVVTANGSVTSLQIVDSGVGYANGEIMLYTSADGLRSGEAKAVVEGIGTGSGYYKTSKGFLSGLSKVHDGDYYQEYSYEILSRIPLEKYADMYKKVMHAAGTRFFGSVLLEDILDASVNVGGTETLFSDFDFFRFNGNTGVSASNGVITVSNLDGNNAIRFANTDKVYYKTLSSNVALTPLVNAAAYYVTNATNTSIQLTTNPRLYTYPFNTANAGYGYIDIGRHNLRVGDYVRYTVATGNTSLYGLKANSNYFVAAATSNTVTLSAVSNAVYTTMSNNSLVLDATSNVAMYDISVTTVFFSPDGVKMYLGGNGNDRIHQFTLTTPWSIATAVYAGNNSVLASGEGNINEMYISPDGLNLYFTGTTLDGVTRKTMSTPWDITTATGNTFFDANTLISVADGSNTSTMSSMDFKPDGTKFYLNCSARDRAYQFNMSTPWDITTATYAGATPANLGDGTTAVNGIAFSQDGTKLYTVGQSNDRLWSGTLTTPWEANTYVADNEYCNMHFLSDSTMAPSTLFMSPDRSKFYMVDTTYDILYELSWYTSLPNGLTQSGHSLSIAPINILPSNTVNSNGHIIETVNEI